MWHNSRDNQGLNSVFDPVQKVTSVCNNACGDVVAHWGDLVARYRAQGFWGRGPGLASGISHNDADVRQDHSEIL